MRSTATVPPWVRPAARDVAGVEQAARDTGRSVDSWELLGTATALSWLIREPGPYMEAPATRRPGVPDKWRARAEWVVAATIVQGRTYPEPSWWESLGLRDPDRFILPEEWQRRLDTAVEPLFARGVMQALAWGLGEIEDPGELAPCQAAGRSLSPARREKIADTLRVSAIGGPVVR